jgi:hypothetical protein
VSPPPGRTAGPDRVAVTTREFVAAIQLSRSGVRCGRRSTGCGILLECGLTRAHMSPWRKGGVENANGRVRRFLPRETGPGALAPAHLRRLADRLNDTPRRCLGYRTPREVFEQHLAAPAGPP